MDEDDPVILNSRQRAGLEVLVFFERIFRLLTFSDALATVLFEYEEDKQAKLVLRDALTELSLYRCHIGEKSAEIVANFLKSNETAKKLRLHSCNIGLRELDVIAEALKHNRTVEFLNVEGNLFGDEGAATLISALKYNVCIRWIFTAGNKIAREMEATIDYIAEKRNAEYIPAMVRRASLSLISARRLIADAGYLAIFPKEIVKMIAMEVWATRKGPKWVQAISEAENKVHRKQFIDETNFDSDSDSDSDDWFDELKNSRTKN